MNPATCPPDTVPAVEDRLRRQLERRPRREDPRGRRAAVLVPLFTHDAVPHVLLTKRPDHLPNHPGQISLPGGSMDPDDADIVATALRETHEEVGIPAAAVRVVGLLDDTHVPVSGFTVTPVVGVIDAMPEIVVNPDEIDRVLRVPWADLLRLDAALPATLNRTTLRYPVDGEDVWGATARILHGLIETLTAP